MNRLFTTYAALAMLLVFLAAGQAFAQTYWDSTDSPRGASLSYLAFHPDGDWFAVGNRSLLTSGDGGSSWSRVPTDVRSLGAMLILPNGTMFSTVDFNGLYQSTDKGRTWISVNMPVSNQNFAAFARAASGTIYAGSGGAGVFKSTDNGVHWTWIQSGLASNNIRGLAVNPVSGNIYAATGSGVSRSTNGGTNWTSMSVKSKLFYSVVTDSSGRIYAARNGGIARSTDDGATWTESAAGLTDTTVLGLAVTNDGTVFAQTLTAIYKSTDHGVNWTAAMGGMEGFSILTLAVKGGNTLVAGTWAGVFTSTDQGDHWTQHVAGLPRMNVQDPVVLDGGKVFIGLGGGGMYQTAGAGSPWTRVTGAGPRNVVISSLRLAANTFLVGTYYGGVWKTTDNGVTWAQQGLNGLAVPRFVRKGTAIFVPTSSGVRKSTDEGATWDTTSLNNEYLYDLAIDSSGNFLACGNLGLFRSTDNGATWSQTIRDTNSSGNRLLHLIQSLAVAANGTIYNVTGYATSASMRGLHKSTDNGATWTHIATPDSGISKIAISPSGDLYAGLDTGVIRSHNGGTTWTNVSAGLASMTGVEYIEFASSGDIWLGTSTGVYKSTSTATAVNEHGSAQPRQFSLEQNYPNPFNPQTIIQYSIPEAGHVRLVVFNTLGQVVKVLVDETQNVAGAHSVQFDGSAMASGVYFYRLEAGKFSQMKKLLLVK